MLRIITYNIYYGEQLTKIYSWLESLEKKPDIICFQEFPKNELRSLGKQNIVENMSFCFSSGLAKDNKVFGQVTVFNTKKLTLSGKKSIPLGTDYLEKFYKKNPNKRSALLSIFEYRDSMFVLVNVHLSALSINSKRREQISIILKQLKSSATMILGDFNYSSLWGRTGLINFMKDNNFEVAGEKMITNRYKRKIPQQLDYVFFKNIKLNNVAVEKVDFSDHYPVIVEMEIKRIKK